LQNIDFKICHKTVQSILEFEKYTNVAILGSCGRPIIGSGTDVEGGAGEFWRASL